MRPPLSDDEAYDRFMQDQLDDEVFGPAEDTMKFQITVVDDSPNSVLDSESTDVVTIKRRDVVTFEVVPNRDTAVLEEAIRIICADAWPNQPYNAELYVKRARLNLSVREQKAKESHQ